MASWWCAIHGYRHPALDAAVREQLGRMAHVMFGGLTHEPAVRLARAAGGARAGGLERVFLADSGSVSVEVAIKLCLQYQRARGRRAAHAAADRAGAAITATRSARWRCATRSAGCTACSPACCPQHVFAERPPDGFDAGLDERWAAHVRELARAPRRRAGGA